MKAWMSLNFGGIPPLTGELAALAPSFLIRSFSFMQVRRSTIISRTSSKFGKIRPYTAELAALERSKKIP